MSSKIEGISAETVDAVRTAIAAADIVGKPEQMQALGHHFKHHAHASITTLLASGQVAIVQKQDEVEHYESCECCGNFHRMEQERDALKKFKDFVHKRLDDAGIPTHPEGEHSQRGCRIGDRLDIILNWEVMLRKDVEELVGALTAAKTWGLAPIERERDWKLRDDVERIIDKAIAKFTTKPTIGEHA